MSKQKTHNSILILTTLGVYLGLVLVGATPQLRAQTVKAFAKAPAKAGKPDINGEFTDAPLERFLDRIKLEVGVKRLDLSRPIHIKVDGAFDKGAVLSGNLNVLADGENSAVLLDLVKEFLVAVDESNLFYTIVDAKSGQSVNGASIDVVHDGAQTTFHISLKTDSAETAERAAGGFRGLFSIAKSVRKGTPEVKFYENAIITFDNDQVSVVTHMPRAALEEFLTGSER